MNIRSKLQDFKNRLSDRHMYSIVLVVVAVLASIGIYQYKQSIDYRTQLENQYHRSFNELVQYVNNIETSLAKGVIVTDPKSMVRLANEVYSQSAFASANLGQLPISHVQLENTSRFLSQVGDFTYFLSLKHLDNQQISPDEHDELLNLSRYAVALNQSLLEMQNQLYSGALRFGDIKGAGDALFGQNQTAMASGMEEVEKQFAEYPTLIYDGPFSDHIHTAEPALLKDGTQLSAEQAAERAAEIVGEQRAPNLSLTGESEGLLPGYTFTSSPDEEDKNRIVTLEMTKVNGAVSWMLDNRYVGESTISIDEAKGKAAEYLAAHGFSDMVESYYEIKSNIAIINYASKQDGIVMYPDLVKIRIAMDSGEMMGLECKGYVMNHKMREIPASFIPESEALSKVSQAVEVSNTKLCVIPLESAREVFCYEITCNVDEKTFLIYINAETGAQENILMLLESETGTLTI